MEHKTLSVSELNNHIKTMFDSDSLLFSVAVMGEVSNYKTYPSGHHYFTLKDNESTIRCVMFKNNASKLVFLPENGMSVTAIGRVSVYLRDGSYQLYCNNMMPDGMGTLHIAFEQLKEKLFKEGLFDNEHKKPIPRFPKTIAVVTSSAGAAIRDVIRILAKRWPMSKVAVLPVRVQGDEAPAEIAGAIRYANKYKAGDLIIVGRGGGSIEDLWAFNTEIVARAIYESDIPVVSAVGHEPDITISDYVADLRAATPSNAAELSVPEQNELREMLKSLDLRAGQAMGKTLSQMRARTEDIASRRVLKDYSTYIDQKRMELDSRANTLSYRYEELIAAKKHQYVHLAASLDALSPLKVLSRGYSVVTDKKGRALTDADEAEVGDILTVSLSKGSLLCEVEEVIAIDGGKNGRERT